MGLCFLCLHQYLYLLTQHTAQHLGMFFKRKQSTKIQLQWPAMFFFYCISPGRQRDGLCGRRPHGSGQQDVPPQHPPAVLQPPRGPRLLRLSLQTRPQRHQHGRLGAAHRWYTNTFWRKTQTQENKFFYNCAWLFLVLFAPLFEIKVGQRKVNRGNIHVQVRKKLIMAYIRKTHLKRE